MSSSEPRPTVLMVDDDPDWRYVAGQWLERDYDVVGVGSGEELLGQLEAYEPDLLLLDIGLPGTDGLRLCRSLRSHARFAGLPVLFVSGYGADATFAEALRSGGTAFLQKPVTRRRLLLAVRDLCALSPMAR